MQEILNSLDEDGIDYSTGSVTEQWYNNTVTPTRRPSDSGSMVLHPAR